MTHFGVLSGTEPWNRTEGMGHVHGPFDSSSLHCLGSTGTKPWYLQLSFSIYGHFDQLSKELRFFIEVSLSTFDDQCARISPREGGGLPVPGTYAHFVF